MVALAHPRTAFGNESSLQDLTRQQAFASEGDAIFQPKGEALPVRQYESPFISPPTAPQANPFSSQQTYERPTKHVNSHDTTNNNHILGSQSPKLPLLRTGHLGIMNNNDTRHSSPEMSIESSILSSSMNGATHQDQIAASSYVHLQIPDINKDQNQRNRNGAQMQARSESNTSRIIFSPHIASAKLASNARHLDIQLEIVMHIRSAKPRLDYESSHVKYYWYSDLKNMHQHLSLNRNHNINFPPLSNGYSNAQETVSENDVERLQKYLRDVTDRFFNVEHETSEQKEFLTFFDNGSNSFRDKIRIMQLEARMIDMMNCCDSLQRRLQFTENTMSENANFVAFLRQKVERLENGNSIPRHNSENIQQGDMLRSTVNNAYGAQQSQNAVNFNNNIETMFGNIRVENGIENSFDPSQIVNIAEEVLNEKGPLPVGEVGKMLQEATGNPHFSQVLKERHNGLKKFLEKYADKFIMSCDHPFNPHVYLRRSYSPDDQRIIEGGSKIFLDKKPKKPRRKEKKTWPSVTLPSPGSYSTRSNYP